MLEISGQWDPGEERKSDDRNSLWCNYCHKPRHTCEYGQKLYGKPGKGGSNREEKPTITFGQAHQAATIDVSWKYPCH